MNNLPVELKDKIFEYVDYNTLCNTRPLQSEYIQHKTRYKSYFTCIKNGGSLDNLKWIYENDLDEFNTFIYEKAIRFCNFEAIKWFWSIGGKNFRSNINNAIEAGRSVETLEKLCSILNFEVDQFTRFNIESYSETIDTFRWGISKGIEFTEVSAMNVIRRHSGNASQDCIENGIEILDYLQTELGIVLGPNSFFVAANVNGEGCVEYLRYIYTSNKILKREVITLEDENVRIGFLRNCSLDILKLLHEEIYQFTLYDAVFSNRIHFVKWLYPKVNKNLDMNFTLNNDISLEIIKFLVNEGYTFDSDAADTAISNEMHPQILKYLYFDLDLQFRDDAAYKVCCWVNGIYKLETLMFLYDIGCYFDHLSVTKAIEKGDVVILNYLVTVVGLEVNGDEAMEVDIWQGTL